MTEPLPPPDIEQLGTPIAWSDRNGRIEGCNGAFARWLGVSPRRLRGLKLDQIDTEAPRLDELLSRLSPGADVPLYARRASLRVPPGQVRLADLWLACAEDRVLIEAHPIDVGPGGDYDDALPNALHAALKGLAHEVKNPLAGLKGAAQLLARRSEDADARRYVEVILHECDRLAALVDRLLNPAPSHSMRPTNVHEALERVRLLAEAEAGDSVRLVRDYDPSLPEILGDPDRLTQALWNLVRNALEAQATEIRLRTRAEHNALIGDRPQRLALRVDIEDNGRGVPDGLADRIFLPLVSGRAEGTGLGLTLAQQVAREHRGALSFRSRPGATVFTLLLPVE
jgi:two-component system nitrogen regulation sensor histidine kinase GlnL